MKTIQGTNCLMYEIKTEDVYDEDFSSNKEMFDFSNYSTKSKYYDNSKKLVIRKMKDVTKGVAIEEFVGLKPKMYSLLIDNSEHKKAKAANRNVVATVSHSEYKDMLLNNKCVRHTMNRIQSKCHRIGTYGSNKISWSCFDGKIIFKTIYTMD